jgi:hypothetical protein
MALGGMFGADLDRMRWRYVSREEFWGSLLLSVEWIKKRV